MLYSYDAFVGAFLAKISEFEFAIMSDDDRSAIIDDYLKRAVVAFRKNCKVDLGAMDDGTRTIEIPSGEDVDELIEVISEGMVVQWLKPYVYQQEILQNTLSTRDFSLYSPAELLKQVNNAYRGAKRDYTQMIREYSYNHGNLTELHS